MIRRIRRVAADGTVSIVEVAADYVLLDGETEEAPTEPQQPTAAPATTAAASTPVDVSGIPPDVLNRIRSEERDRVRSTISSSREEAERARQEATQAREQLAEIERQRRAAELESMRPNERQAVELQEAVTRAAQAEAALEAERTANEQRQRGWMLTAYRERVIREYNGELFPQTVQGNTEAEMDAAALASHQAYKAEVARIRAVIAAELAATSPVPAATPASPAPPVAIAPHNPAYVAPVAGSPQFPTVANPEPVTPASNAPMSIADLTTEEAVRSGRWGGEVRQQAIAQLKAMTPNHQPLGYSPRMQPAAPPVGYTAMPGGVMQPQGIPTVHPNLPHMATPAPAAPAQPMAPVAPPPAATPAALTPAQAAVAEAQAAVARTHAGQNPLISSNPAAARALADTRSAGVDPRAAFAARFQNSPPASE